MLYAFSLNIPYDFTSLMLVVEVDLPLDRGLDWDLDDLEDLDDLDDLDDLSLLFFLDLPLGDVLQ